MEPYRCAIASLFPAVVFAGDIVFVPVVYETLQCFDRFHPVYLVVLGKDTSYFSVKQYPVIVKLGQFGIQCVDPFLFGSDLAVFLVEFLYFCIGFSIVFLYGCDGFFIRGFIRFWHGFDFVKPLFDSALLPQYR